MKLSKATILLKAVLVFSAIALGLVVFSGVPGYMQHVVHERPDLAGWDYPMRGYGLLLALPVWAVMVLLLQVFDTIPKNAPFCTENAQRFHKVSRLAEIDLGLVLVLGTFLVINGVTPAFIMGSLMLATFAGIVAAVVFHVLAGLVRNAAELKQDSDMTI